MECLGNRKSYVSCASVVRCIVYAICICPRSSFSPRAILKTDRFTYKCILFLSLSCSRRKYRIRIIKISAPSYFLYVNLTYILSIKIVAKIHLDLYLHLYTYMKFKEPYQFCNWYKIYGN